MANLEKRSITLRIRLTPTEFKRLQRETTSGGRKLKMSSLARQRIFTPSSVQHQSLVTLQANLQHAYQGLCHIVLCLRHPLSHVEQTQLLAFVSSIIQGIDQTTD